MKRLMLVILALVTCMTILSVPVFAGPDPYSEVVSIGEENGYTRYSVINVPELNALIGGKVTASPSGFRQGAASPENVINGYEWADGWVVNKEIAYTDEDPTPWIQIDMKNAATVDQVYLYPRDTGDVNYAKNFPIKFKITGQKADNSWVTLVDYSSKTYPDPNPLGSKNVKPVNFKFDPVKIKALKLEVYEATGSEDSVCAIWISEIVAIKAEASGGSSSGGSSAKASSAKASSSVSAGSSSSDSSSLSDVSSSAPVPSEEDVSEPADSTESEPITDVGGSSGNTVIFIVLGVVIIVAGVVAGYLIVKKRRNV